MPKYVDSLSRSYKHGGRCNGVTKVSGQDLVLLECPFRPVNATFCTKCNGLVPLNTVAWTDTGESIDKYRLRIYTSIQPWQRARLACMGTAFEGALRLNLTADGKRQGPELPDRSFQPAPVNQGAFFAQLAGIGLLALVIIFGIISMLVH